MSRRHGPERCEAALLALTEDFRRLVKTVRRLLPAAAADRVVEHLNAAAARAAQAVVIPRDDRG